MKQSLQLRLGQQLSMTPQLQQAVKLLQLSSLDLQTEIRQVIENNPLLEFDDDNTTADNRQTDNSNQPTGENPDAEYDQYQQPDGTEWNRDNEYTIRPSNHSLEEKNIDFPETREDLKTHLYSQANTMQLSNNDQLIANALINAIDDDGYLSTDIDEICSVLPRELEITNEDINVVLNIIQHFDPVGVGARNLRECLLLQLGRLPENHIRQVTTHIVRDHFDSLRRRDYAHISRVLGYPGEEIQRAVDTIQSLNPRPGGCISTVPTEYIIPDVLVRKVKGQWQAMLNADLSPQLKINNYYASLIRRADDSRDNQFLKNNLQEARWFLKSLQNRNDTLLKVATLIVQQQQAFLEYGEEHMKPLTLRDIAEAIGMHESTISRVKTQKYIHTPHGIYELKYFFSSHVSTVSGGECSSTAIRAIIKKLITSEDKYKPFSDSKLVQLLEQKGIKVARRTVAKYRENLLIPPSNERRLRA